MLLNSSFCAAPSFVSSLTIWGFKLYSLMSSPQALYWAPCGERPHFVDEEAKAPGGCKAWPGSHGWLEAEPGVTPQALDPIRLHSAATAIVRPHGRAAFLHSCSQAPFAGPRHDRLTQAVPHPQGPLILWTSNREECVCPASPELHGTPPCSWNHQGQAVSVIPEG